MHQKTAQLPSLIAGPLLRRVRACDVCVWLALSHRAEFRLTFSGKRKKVMPEVHEVQVGTHLFIYLLKAVPASPFETDKWIDYTIEIANPDVKRKSWKALLNDQDRKTMFYPERSSFGFIRPSTTRTVLHGSCRKPHHESEDGLVEADRYVESLFKSETQENVWPTALVMSGDQIYGDDVAGPMLQAIHQVMTRLGVFNETLPGLSERGITDSESLFNHYDSFYHRDDILPRSQEARALGEMVFEGVRKPIFTSDSAHNHLVTFGEYLVMYLMVWSDVPWQIIDLERPENLRSEDAILYDKEEKIIKHFVQGLGKVRRLLAHLPSAMIFDDHDVTDDWNLHRQWEETAYGNDFSRRMIGNGLMSYLVCQGWGNRPEVFDDALMEKLNEAVASPGSEGHDDFITELLRFQDWDYEWDGEPALIVIDTRTRRWRSESSAVQPSGLLDWEALSELQIKLQNRKSVLLVSPAPIFGVKLIETIQRIFTWLGKPLMVDAENWMSHPGTANAILNVFRHSKTPENFVVLSGDVHYSFVYDVELKGREGGPDIWQVCSSGFKNEFPRTLLDYLDVINRFLYAPKSPLNWLTRRRRMRIIPRKPEGHKDGRRLLNAAGIGLVELDEEGRPSRVQQLVAGGKPVGFYERMENHSRWE